MSYFAPTHLLHFDSHNGSLQQSPLSQVLPTDFTLRIPDDLSLQYAVFIEQPSLLHIELGERASLTLYMYSEQCAQVNIQVQQAPESRFNLHQSFAAETSALRLQTHLTRGSSLSHTLRLLAGKGQHTAHSLLEIEPHARHASITQQVQALKRHPQAQVQLQPFLAIHHHQVQATHGTAIGAPDAASIEYLVSHGFEEKDAINMLCRAFLHEHLPLELFHETP